MNIPIFVVDAFTQDAFAGNPAGVCFLESEADAAWMQKVAMEMKHAETAFVRPIDDGYELRWFTPTVEVDLCGHATLASAHALWESGELPESRAARFFTRSGLLVASKRAKIELDFPNERPSEAVLPDGIAGVEPIWTGRNRMDWLVELGNEEDVRTFDPDFESIAALGLRGLIITAKAEGQFDFVSRFFAPQSGVSEDSVTGSAHCCLGPFWGQKLGKGELLAYQASERGGVVGVELKGDRVTLKGDAVTTLVGRLRC